MRKMRLAILVSSFSRRSCAALVASVLLLGVTLGLRAGSFGPVLQRVHAARTHFPLMSNPTTGVHSVSPQRSLIPTGREVREQFAAMPLRFEENRGQAAQDALFLARGNGSVLFLTRTAMVMALPRDEGLRDPRKLSGLHSWANRPGTQARSLSVLRLELADANPAAHVLCSEELPGKSNYFHGNNPKRWLTNIPNCARVRYENVYPGVDLVYYGDHQRFENDYILAPGADPRRVRLSLRGASALRLNPAGDLVVDVHGSSLLLRRPRAYQASKSGTQEVLAEYTFPGKDIVGFKVGSYDHSRSLTIDPVLTYSTFLGGTGGDQGAAITVDSSGNIYVVGTTSSANFPTTAGVFQSKLAGGSDVFVSKLSPAGALLFSTYIGGTGSDSGAAIAVDSAGKIYLTGTTSSTDFPTTAGVVQTTFNTPSDAFVTKLSADGTALIYSTYLGGLGVVVSGFTYGNSGYGIAVDSSGKAYVTGQTYSTTFPVNAGSFQAADGGAGDGFITKLSPDATSIVYSSYLGGSGTDLGVSVAVDASGEAVIVGTTYSSDFPTVSPLQAALGGGNDAFVAKVNSTGTALVFSTYLGGTGADQGADLALDGSGNIYLTGSTSSADFPTMSPAQSKLGGSTNAFVSELKANGSALVYSTYLGGSSSDYGNGIAVDSSGNAYVVGTATSSDFPSVNPIDGYNPSSSSPYDAYLARIASGGASFAFASYLGGAGNDGANGVALDKGGNAYIVGTTNSADFPTTVGSYQPTFGKLSNAFVMEVGPASKPGFSPFPNQLTFSDQGVGTSSSPQGIRVRNMGSAVLSTSSITTTGDFAETDDCGIVASASECTLRVTFSPSARGTSTGTLSFSDNAPGSPQTINLTGNGVSPVITLSPSSLTFPGAPLNTTGPTQTVTMSNAGADSSTIRSITTGGDFTQSNSCGTSLAAGASCKITVAFKPTLNGTRTGSLFVSDNSPGSPHTVSLTGTGVGPDAMLSAGTLNFSDQPVGTTSGPQIVTLTNDGSASMTIAGIQTIGGFADTTKCGASLAAGMNCTISVTFQPTATGVNSGALTISDNAPGSPQTVTLIGDAVKGPAPVAYLSPTTLTFGPQPVSTTSLTQSITVTNTGNATLDITQYSNTGPFTVGSTNCGTQLAAGARCGTQISFAPTAAGPATGTYSLTDNASGSPHVVTFSGSGIDFGMTATPGGVAVTAGQPATYTLTVIPSPGFDKTVSLSCTGVPQTTTCSITPTSVSLDGTNSLTATVTVSTTVRSGLLPIQKAPRAPEFTVPFGMVGLGLFLTLAVLTAMGGKRSRAGAGLIAGLLLFALLWGACAVGNEKITGTLAGNYAFSVTGAYTPSGTGTLQHTIQLGLTVN